MPRKPSNELIFSKTSGLYYKHIMIINDDSRVSVSELQIVASLMSIIDNTKANETFIVQASLKIVTYNHQNIL